MQSHVVPWYSKEPVWFRLAPTTLQQLCAPNIMADLGLHFSCVAKFLKVYHKGSDCVHRGLLIDAGEGVHGQMIRHYGPALAQQQVCLRRAPASAG